MVDERARKADRSPMDWLDDACWLEKYMEVLCDFGWSAHDSEDE